MITANVFHRVFHIKYGDGGGTCFTIDVGGKQYVVTARHVVEGIKDGEEVGILFRQERLDLPTRVIGIGEGDIDIAVLAVPMQLSPQLDLEADHKHFTLGQDVYFLGFPFGLRFKLGDLNRGFPFPFVRKGILSAMGANGLDECYLLDGHANDGFSGGPVVFEPPGRLQASPGEIIQVKFKVAAVVASYKLSEEPVLHENKETKLHYDYNTGIVVCYDILCAVRMIQAKPNGFILPPKGLGE
jgi:hypothetical protein